MLATARRKVLHWLAPEPPTHSSLSSVLAVAMLNQTRSKSYLNAFTGKFPLSCFGSSATDLDASLPLNWHDILVSISGRCKPRIFRSRVYVLALRE